MDAKELRNLISLLDDPDTEIFRAVSERIVSQGIAAIPMLEKAWEASLDEVFQGRIENLIHSIQFNSASANLARWVASGAQSLLEGTFFVAQYQYPELTLEALEKNFERIRKDVWIELNENLTALEKVKILNHVIYTEHGFTGNTTNFFAPQFQYVNTLFETKRGGPIILAVFYSIVAQKLGLPIYCVNLPKNFILAYKDRFRPLHPTADAKDSILFYINPFNMGSVLGRREIEHFLNQQQIAIKDEYFLPCTNRVAVAQQIFNLIYCYEKAGNSEKAKEYKQLFAIVEEKEVA